MTNADPTGSGPLRPLSSKRKKGKKDKRYACFRHQYNNAVKAIPSNMARLPGSGVTNLTLTV
jgi:hypothetical protein